MENLTQRILSSLQEHDTLRTPQTLDRQTITDLQTLLDNAINDPEITSEFYAELASKNLSAASVTRPLAFTMDSGPTHMAILSANVFLSLILSPNAPVLTIFTPMAFISLLRAVRRALKGRVGAVSDGVRTVNRKKRKGGRKGRNEEVGGLGEEEEEGDGVLDVREVFPVLERLELVLGLIHLDRFPDSLKALIQTVAQVPVAGVEVCGSSGVYGKLCELCCRIFGEVLKDEHGDQANSAAEVLRALAPLVLMGKGQARSFAMGFVVKTMVRMGKEEEGVNNAVVNFPKYLTQKAPERSEPRALAVETIMEVVRVLEFKDQVGFVEYVVKMTQGKSNLRLLGVDLILMLVMLLRDPSKLGEEMELRDSVGLKCLKALIQRCSDAVAGIRGRALSILTQLVVYLSGDGRNKKLLKKVMGFDDVNSRSRDGGIAGLLRTRCMDEKAVVRKAALHLVTKLTALSGVSFDPVVLKMMGMACSDSLVSIRKAAVSALSEAYRTFHDKSIITEWLHSVPRLVADNESGIQEECENLFLELVLDQISKAGSTLPKGSSINSNSNTQKKCIEMEIECLVPEGILVILKELCDGDVAPWVKKICTSLGKKKRLKPIIAVALQNIIRTSESLWLKNSMPIDKWTAPPGAWLLLSEVSAYLSKAVEWEFLHHHWQLLDKYAKGSEFHSSFTHSNVNGEDEGAELHSVSWAGDRVFLLQTISNVSVELPPEPAADLAHNLLKRIEEFNMHLTEINAHVKALKTLCKRKALTVEEADNLVMNWVNRLLSKAASLIEKYIAEDVKLNKDSSFLTPPTSSRKGKRVATRLLSQAINAVYTIGPLIIICPSADISHIIPILHPIITSGKSDLKLNKLPGSTISLKQTAPSLYIQAWLTMGKICLADGKLAKRYIPLFVQELEKTDCAALRNNLVVMMADFCVRYTALVDCYITKITKCLRDPCELVRRQTFILLSRLLQRDYVKWRGVLFLRFLFPLVDESEKIRQLAEFLFGNILKVKAPLLAYNSFVEAIFVLNDYSAHNGHNESRGSRAERKLFSIKGNDENTRSKRMHIYITLLKQMAPEHLLATFAKVSAEILAAASDGMLNIDDVTGQSVLLKEIRPSVMTSALRCCTLMIQNHREIPRTIVTDAFQILSCKDIRLHPSRGSSELAEMEEEGGENGASASAARGRVITQAVKKGLIQNTIPIFIELKRLLENKRSPLMGSLMECLRNLLKDYKTEIDEILVADQQLQRELVYDMQKYEAARAKTTAAEAAATMQRSYNFQTPGPSNVVTRTAAEVQGNPTVASAMASAAAEATVVSVLKEVNQGVPTPQLSSIKVPRLRSASGQDNSPYDRPMEVLESLRKRQSFDSDGEN